MYINSYAREAQINREARKYQAVNDSIQRSSNLSDEQKDRMIGAMPRVSNLIPASERPAAYWHGVRAGGRRADVERMKLLLRRHDRSS